MEANCRNCDITLTPGYDYCPKCSQKVHLHRLDFQELLHETVHYFTHADKGLFQLIRDLAIKKGLVAKEFIEGKRKKYYPPLTFFFLVIAINVFVSTKTDDHANVNIEAKYPEVRTISDPAVKAKWIQIYSRREQGVHFINTNINTISMISLPIISLIFWLYYRRRQYNYVEHLVAGMYMYGFYTLILIVLNVLTYLLHTNENIGYAIGLIFQLTYNTIFYRSFMNGKWPRAFLASMTTLLFMFILSGVLMWLYMFNVV